MRRRDDEDAARGRQAERPRDIPREGWWDILVRTKREVSRDNVSIVAAGVAYFAFLSIFPALAAILALYGLVADPAQVQQQIMATAGGLPEEVRTLLSEQMTRLAAQTSRSLGWGAAIAILVALWSANRAVSALVTALSIAYDEDERRGFFKRTALTLAFTVGGILVVVVASGLVIVVPAVLARVGLSDAARTIIDVLRWPLLAAAVLLALAVLYRYGPSRATPRWRWVTWGSVLATALWLVASYGLSFYVSRFGNYNETYGSIAGIAILLLWLYLGAYLVILGAELNGQIEHQTARDSTEGAPSPLGRRGAFHADTVGGLE